MKDKLNKNTALGYSIVAVIALFLSIKAMMVWFTSPLYPELSVAISATAFSMFFVSGFSIAIFVLGFIKEKDAHYVYLQSSLSVVNVSLLTLSSVWLLESGASSQLSEIMFKNEWLLASLFISILATNIALLGCLFINTKYIKWGSNYEN